MSALYAIKKAQKTAECAKPEVEKELHPVLEEMLKAESSFHQKLGQALDNMQSELEAKISQLDVKCSAHQKLRQRLNFVELKLWNGQAELYSKLRAEISHLDAECRVIE